MKKKLSEHTVLTLPKRLQKSKNPFWSLRSTKNGIQSCSLHQLKWNLLHKNNNDVRTITLSIRGISFQFRLAMKSFFVTQSARFICVSVLFPIQITKHELIYVCFLNFDCTYLYKIKTAKERDFVSRIALIPRVVSQIIFSSLWASEISAFFIFQPFFKHI